MKANNKIETTVPTFPNSSSLNLAIIFSIGTTVMFNGFLGLVAFGLSSATGGNQPDGDMVIYFLLLLFIILQGAFFFTIFKKEFRTKLPLLFFIAYTPIICTVLLLMLPSKYQ